MKDSDIIDSYLEEISQLLPYPSSIKKIKLEELRVDVQAAIDDSDTKDPSVAFGSSRDVAKKFSQSQDWGTERAGWNVRLLAYIFDSIISLGITIIYVLAGLFIIISLFMPFDEFLDLLSEAWDSLVLFGRAELSLGGWLGLSLGESIVFGSLLLVLIVTAILIAITYFIVQEYLFSATIGKKILKLSVVDESGIKITWQQTIIRNLTKPGISNGFLPFDLIIGMVLEKQNPEKTQKQRSLDILAETIVIKLK